ncbi:MAG: alpha-ribazole phosphatase [Desulfobulbaceae bacterium]
MRLVLIRHAATTGSDQGVLLGATDAEATPAGLRQAGELVPRIKEYGVRSWFVSPMKRAGQTMETLARCGCPGAASRTIDDRLREMDFGRWEGMTFDAVVESDPDLVAAWSRYEDFVFPGGESVSGFTGRVAAVLEDLRSQDSGTVGLVTHGGVIRTMICLALGLAPRNYLLFAVEPASLTVLDLHSGGGVLHLLNG